MSGAKKVALSDALRFRVPNPPSVFVGREREAAELVRWLQRGPLGVVCGAGGLGKSALVFRVVHGPLAHRVAASVVVRARAEDDFDQLGAELLRALGVEVARGATSPEELAVRVIDRAERAQALVVLEDLHHVRAEDAARWLALIASYARRSRWIVTTRARPRLPEIQEQVIELDALPDEASRALASSCRPELDGPQLDLLVASAAGSPFWIRQLAATDDAGSREGKLRESERAPSLLRGLSAEAIRYLEMLSLSREPLGATALGDEARALVDRGTLVLEAETARVHDVAADHVLARLSSAERDRAAREAGAALEHASGAEARLEALRLALARHDLEAADRLLDAWETWLRGGLGARLFAILVSEHEPRFAERKLRIALAVDSGASLAWLVAQPRPDEERARLVWIEGLVRSGRPKRALEELEALDAEGASSSDTFAHVMLRARALCDAGDASASVALLRGVRPADPREAARRDLALARALFHADDAAESMSLLDRVQKHLASLPAAEARALRGERRGLLIQLGMRDEVGDDSMEEARGLGVESLIFFGLRLAAAGRFSGSHRILTRLEDSADLSSGNSVLARIAGIILRVPKGEFAGLDVLSRNLVREAEHLGFATLYHWAFLAERLVNLGRACELPELPWAASIPGPTGIPERYLQVLRISHAARRGEPLDEDAIPRARPADGPLVHCVCELAEANARLLAGDGERAAFLAAQVVRRTREAGYAFFRGEALLIRVYADLALGRKVELARGLDELSDVATALQSRRYRELARLLASALEEEPDPVVLFSVAQASDASPMVARVAAALLGAPAGPDALDRLLIEGIRNRWRARIEVLGEGACGWVFDPRARVVWHPAGRVTLSSLSARVLETLVEAGGRASLESLACAAWELEEFHPLRDSKRVHVALRRLRQQIEDDPSTPRRVLTEGDAYVLAQAPPLGIVRDVTPES